MDNITNILLTRIAQDRAHYNTHIRYVPQGPWPQRLYWTSNDGRFISLGPYVYEYLDDDYYYRDVFSDFPVIESYEDQLFIYYDNLYPTADYIDINGYGVVSESSNSLFVALVVSVVTEYPQYVEHLFWHIFELSSDFSIATEVSTNSALNIPFPTVPSAIVMYDNILWQYIDTYYAYPLISCIATARFNAPIILTDWFYHPMSYARDVRFAGTLANRFIVHKHYDFYALDLTTSQLSVISPQYVDLFIHYSNNVIFPRYGLPLNLETLTAHAAIITTNAGILSVYWQNQTTGYGIIKSWFNLFELRQINMTSYLTRDINDSPPYAAKMISFPFTSDHAFILGANNDNIYILYYHMFNTSTTAYIYRFNWTSSTHTLLATLNNVRDIYSYLKTNTHSTSYVGLRPTVANKDALLIFDTLTEQYELKELDAGVAIVSIVLDKNEVIVEYNDRFYSLGSPQVGQPLVLEKLTDIDISDFIPVPYCVGSFYAYRYNLYSIDPDEEVIFNDASGDGLSSRTLVQTAPDIIFTSFDKSQQQTVSTIPMLKSG